MLEQTQILRYPLPGGHGFAAEDANNLNDKLRGNRNFQRVERSRSRC